MPQDLPRRVERHKHLPQVDPSSRPASRGRDDSRRPSLAAAGAPRSKKEKSSRDVTPVSSPDPRRASAPSSASASRVFGASGEITPRSPKPDPVEFSQDDWRLVKKKLHPKKHQPSAAVRHFEGPVLQARKRPFHPPTLSRGNSAPSSASYAQAVQSMGPRVQVQPRSAIETRAAWDVHRPEPHAPTPTTKRAVPLLEVQESVEVDSDDASSVFDVEEDDIDRLSDFETDISASSIYERGLPPELDSDDRLLNPHQYFAELENLESSVAANSGLFLMAREKRQAYPDGASFNLKFRFESHCGEGITSGAQSYDGAFMKYCRSKKPSMTNERDLAYWAFHVLECRNLMLSVTSNVERMKKARYCTTSFNALALDPDRHSVARFVRIDVAAVYDLHRAFESLIMDVEALLKDPAARWQKQLDDQARTISQRCRCILQQFGLPQASNQVGVWRQAALVLELSIVSYCGAHIERFDLTFLGEDLDLAKLTAAWTYVTDGSEGIMIRRRSLRCVDKFLRGHQVWVFQSQKRWQDSSDLYLSTTIEDFADIWGPVWTVKANEDSKDVLRYNTGSGSIVPWRIGAQHVPLASEETFCHWLSEYESAKGRSDSLTPGTRLLIGGTQIMEQKTAQMKENEACTNRTNSTIQQLKAENRLEYLGTRGETRYLAEEQFGAAIGAYGVAIGTNRVYKKRSAVTLKEAICEAWRNGGGERNPAILEHWLGVEVSFCSRNARRRRLKSVISSRSMRNWLECCKDTAEPFPCEKAFHEAIESRNPRAFRDLYIQHREWRRHLGQLLSWCLEGLRHSTVDLTDYTLRVLWMPQPEKKFRVKLKQSTHTWTGFLADSETTCAFSIMSGKCLHTDYKYGAVCQARSPSSSHLGYTILESALVVNPNLEAPRPKYLELRPGDPIRNKQSRWSISRIPPDEYFRLPNGHLKIIEPFRSTRLLVKWESGVLKKLYDTKLQMAKAVSKRSSLHHWELKDEEDWDVKPIPLFIISEFEHRR